MTNNLPSLELVTLLLQVAVVVFGPIIGWLLKSLFDRIKDLEKADKELADRVQDLAVALPTNYVTKPDHKNALDNIFEALRRIEGKLDEKQDKP